MPEVTSKEQKQRVFSDGRNGVTDWGDGLTVWVPPCDSLADLRQAAAFLNEVADQLDA